MSITTKRAGAIHRRNQRARHGETRRTPAPNQEARTARLLPGKGPAMRGLSPYRSDQEDGGEKARRRGPGTVLYEVAPQRVRRRWQRRCWGKRAHHHRNAVGMVEAARHVPGWPRRGGKLTTRRRPQPGATPQAVVGAIVLAGRHGSTLFVVVAMPRHRGRYRHEHEEQHDRSGELCQGGSHHRNDDTPAVRPARAERPLVCRLREIQHPHARIPPPTCLFGFLRLGLLRLSRNTSCPADQRRHKVAQPRCSTRSSSLCARDSRRF